MAISISANGLATFMKASPARQRSLLRDYKFPFTKEGKRKPQIVRYSEARAAIKKYHVTGNDIAVLIDAVADLAKKAAENPQLDDSRIKDNIRAIQTYMTHFKDNNFEILETPKPKYVHGEVMVSGYPDLYVQGNGSKRLIKLDFNAKVPDPEVIDIILKVMHEAASANELGVQPKDVVYLDVSRQRQYTGKKLNKRLKQDIDAACDTIEDVWPRLKQQ